MLYFGWIVLSFRNSFGWSCIQRPSLPLCKGSPQNPFSIQKSFFSHSFPFYVSATHSQWWSKNTKRKFQNWVSNHISFRAAWSNFAAPYSIPPNTDIVCSWHPTTNITPAPWPRATQSWWCSFWHNVRSKVVYITVSGHLHPFVSCHRHFTISQDHKKSECNTVRHFELATTRESISPRKRSCGVLWRPLEPQLRPEQPNKETRLFLKKVFWEKDHIHTTYYSILL